MIDYKVNSQGVAVLTWNMPDRPVNVMNDDSLAAFSEQIERALADSAVKGMVIASAKRDFVTGADLVSFLSDRRPHVIFEKGRMTQAILRRLETGGKPVCAALTGSALGGGLEIALACHHRIAADNASIRLGLPEVTLGLLPGAGGTQRLPRLIGPRAAIPYLLEGRLMTVAEALRTGVVQEVASEAQVLARAVEWVASQAGPVAQPWDVKGFKLPGGALDPITTYQIFGTETARITARTQNNLPAPRHILSAVFEGCSTDLDTGLKAELRHFVSCVCSVESKNIIRTSFFGVSSAAKLKQRPKGTPELRIERLGVVGNGIGAMDLIQAAVSASLPVTWLQTDGKHVPPEWAPHVTKVANEDDLNSCSFLVTTTPLDVISRATLNNRLNAFVWPAHDMLPAGAVGMRLPSSTSRLVEVVRAEATPDAAIAHVMDLVRRLGKVPLVVTASNGTYVERVIGAYEKAVLQMSKDGVSPVLINSAARQVGMTTAPLPIASDTDAPVSTRPHEWKAAAAQVVLLKNRLLVAQAEEAMLCLEDGVVPTPLDADIGALLGWGFPLHLGGPLGYVDTVGADRFLTLQKEVHPKHPLDPRSERRLKEQVRQAVGFHDD
jgi:3-hydroxyacyl-CoA dehydrogenase/enoyl-CoA hydratase/3-hydroxybutyryl-CoA epimerase